MDLSIYPIPTNSNFIDNVLIGKLSDRLDIIDLLSLLIGEFYLFLTTIAFGMLLLLAYAIPLIVTWFVVKKLFLL